MSDEKKPLVGEPVASNDRGFLLFGGRSIATSYGHEVRVQESSSAEAPHVWLFIDGSRIARDPHLNLAQAIAVHAALSQFIDSVADRWEDGAELLADARRRALGETS